MAVGAMVFAFAFLSFGFILVGNTQAQNQRTTRINDAQAERIIRSVEQRSDRFRSSFDAALDRSYFNGTYTEKSVNQSVQDFEEATNDLRSRFNERSAVAGDVDNILNRAAMIDRFMRTYLKQDRVQSDWTLLKGDLRRLANAYNVAFNLNGRQSTMPIDTAEVPYRVTDSQVRTVINRIETRSDTFRTSLDRALDRSRFDNSVRENNVNDFVKDFENSTDELRRKFDGRTSVDMDVSNVLVRAARIDDFMKSNLRRETIAQRDWRSLRTDLNLLSNYYSLAFNLDNRRGMPDYSNLGGVLTNGDQRFTGTYRLNVNQSDNARTITDQATRNLNGNRRDTVSNNLFNRLQSPEMLAVERNGMRVMLASSRSPQISLDVDGLLHNETYPNGRAASVRATFNGDILTVVTNGDRSNDFTVIFTPIDGGRRMLVTRRVFAEGLNQSVEVKSSYDRTSETAQFNVYDSSNTSQNQNVNTNFFIPSNTTLVATLNQNLSTKTARDGDRFTMTVSSPSQYSGAVIEGFVSNPNRSGRISGRSEFTLNYETITMNNQTYRFAGLTENVRTVAGQDIRVDNEGSVNGSNQTNKTVGRTAIGAGIGALLGALLGGGEGAAIGAGVGAGTGAGSVYIQGRDDLEMQQGAEFTILAAAPRTN